MKTIIKNYSLRAFFAFLFFTLPSSRLTLSAQCNFTISFSGVQNVSCFGGNNGTATASVSGGVLPYTYLWSGGKGTDSIVSNLAQGRYIVQVTDSSGCTAFGTVLIRQPASSVSVTVSETDAICYGGTGSATANGVGGTGSITYQWNDANNTAGATLTASAGSYVVTATDANGCTGTTSVTIGQANQIIITTVELNAATCYGGKGTAGVSASGGTGDLFYQWNDVNNTTGGILSAIAGAYTITVTDGDGCSATSSATIGQPSSAVSVSIASEKDAICNGSYGDAIASAIGGTGTIAYRWNDVNNTANDTLFALAGSYTVTATDANGCSATISISIQQPGAISVTVSGINAACHGGNGSASTLSVSGGIQPYTYLWSSGKTTSNISGINAGNYTLTVSDRNNCMGTSSVRITEPTALILTMSRADTLYIGYHPTTASISGSVSNGTPPYIFQWSNGATVSSITVSPSTSINYSLTVEDFDGCIVSGNVPITVMNVSCGDAKASVCHKGHTQCVDTNAVHALLAQEDTYLGDCIVNNGGNPGGNNGNGGTFGTGHYVNLYPNPFSGKFTITRLENTMHIDIYDYTGRRISALEANDDIMQFDLFNQPDGVYLIRITTKDGNVVNQIKVVKVL